MTTLQSLLGIDLPVIQAPMAGIQVSAMAVAGSRVVTVQSRGVMPTTCSIGVASARPISTTFC